LFVVVVVVVVFVVVVVVVVAVVLLLLFYFFALGCKGARGLKAKRKNVKTTGMTRVPVRRW